MSVTRQKQIKRLEWLQNRIIKGKCSKCTEKYLKEAQKIRKELNK